MMETIPKQKRRDETLKFRSFEFNTNVGKFGKELFQQLYTYCNGLYFEILTGSHHKRKWTSLILLISISYMMEIIPKQKRPFLCLKVHSYTQKMKPFPYIFVMFILKCWYQNYSNMWIVQQMSFQPLTSLVSLVKHVGKFCLRHGTIGTKTWQKCMKNKRIELYWLNGEVEKRLPYLNV
jgi:uncharacterized protein YbgA (DUF1722 family)